jgi:hypothetical protein
MFGETKFVKGYFPILVQVDLWQYGKIGKEVSDYSKGFQSLPKRSEEGRGGLNNIDYPRKIPLRTWSEVGAQIRQLWWGERGDSEEME